jgi:hypothetical protein
MLMINVSTVMKNNDRRNNGIGLLTKIWYAAVLPLSYSESRRGVARKPNLGYLFQ